MAQFTVKWPNGAEVTFEGDVSFDDLQKFLDRADPPAALRTVPRNAPAEKQDGAEAEDSQPLVSLEPARVEAQFAEVGADTDVERVTVLAWMAREAGGPGIDHDTAARIYRELALRVPGNWRSTFSNAATRGYILRGDVRGYWRPSAVGENFARLGVRRGSPAARRRRRTGGDNEG